MPQTIELPEVLITPDNVNHGGIADSWDPSGLGLRSNDFVISGVATNHDAVSDVAGVDSRRSYANSTRAYQDALNQLGNPSVPPEVSWLAQYLGPQNFANFVSAYDQEAHLRTEISTPGFAPTLPSAPKPYPIPGMGPDDIHPIPNYEPSRPWLQTQDIQKAEWRPDPTAPTPASVDPWGPDNPRTNDAMPGIYWTSATNLYGEPTGVPVFPTHPVSSDSVEWNVQPGFYLTEPLTNYDIFDDHLGTPDWFNAFINLGPQI